MDTVTVLFDPFNLGHKSVHIIELSFQGIFHSSTNSEFIVCWCPKVYEVDEETNEQTEIKGEIALLRGDVLQFHKILDDPYEVHVADNGNVCFWDNNILSVINILGQDLIKRRFDANISVLAISANGQYTVCNTAFSSGVDSISVFFFDNELATLLWQVSRHSNLSLGYSFEIDTDRQFIFLVYVSMGRFRYAFDGEFIDSNEFHFAMIAHGYDIPKLIKERIDNKNYYLSKEEIMRTKTELLKAVDYQKEVRENPFELAWVYKALGFICERQENLYEALDYFVEATKYHDRIGVNRRIARIRKIIDDKQ